MKYKIRFVNGMPDVLSKIHCDTPFVELPPMSLGAALSFAEKMLVEPICTVEYEDEFGVMRKYPSFLPDRVLVVCAEDNKELVSISYDKLNGEFVHEWF